MRANFHFILYFSQETCADSRGVDEERGVCLCACVCVVCVAVRVCREGREVGREGGCEDDGDDGEALEQMINSDKW